MESPAGKSAPRGMTKWLDFMSAMSEKPRNPEVDSAVRSVVVWRPDKEDEITLGYTFVDVLRGCVNWAVGF